MEQDKGQKLERILSKERLGDYQTKKAEAYQASPLALYRWNTLLSESLYPLLQTIEVTLRNAMHQAVVEHISDAAWLQSPKILETRDLEEVKRQEARLIKAGKPVSAGNLIAELNFGFWTGLLDARYEMKLWRSRIIKRTFPNMSPKMRTRHYLSRHFNKIRRLRNRIFHYEPIWYWQDLKEQYASIRTAIEWIEPAALVLCTPDRFLMTYYRPAEVLGW